MGARLPGRERHQAIRASTTFAVLHPRPIDVRRAVLGVLMRCADLGAVEGLSLGELRAALLSHDGIELDGKRLADLVRWQMRRGRVSRVRRGAVLVRRRIDEPVERMALPPLAGGATLLTDARPRSGTVDGR